MATSLFSQQWYKVRQPGLTYCTRMQSITGGAILQVEQGINGLFISTDGAKHWKKLPGPFVLANEPWNSGIRPERFFAADSTIYVDGVDNNGVWHNYFSTNLGEEWVEIPMQAAGIDFPALVYKGHLYALHTNLYMARYNTQTDAWEKIFHKSVELYANAGDLWAKSVDSLWRSSDAGLTWSPAPDYLYKSIIRGDTIVQVHRRSFDGGQTWEDLSLNSIATLYDDGVNHYITGGYLTIRSRDFFQTRDTILKQDIRHVCRLDEQSVITFGDWGCYLSNNNGLDWEVSNSGVGPSLYGYALEKAGDYLTAISYAAPGIFIQAFSNDDGVNWTGDPDHRYLSSITQIGNNYFGVARRSVFRSQNELAHWDTLFTLENEYMYNLKMVAIQDTLILMATDQSNGKTYFWLAKNGTDSMTFTQVANAIAPISPQTYVAHNNALFICNDTEIRRSQNYGQTWQSLSIPPIAAGILSDGQRLFFIGAPGMYYSANNGSTWLNIPFPDSMVGQIQAITLTESSMYLVDAAREIYVQQTGTSVWDTLPGFPDGLAPWKVAVLGERIFVPDYFGNIWTNYPIDLHTFSPTSVEDLTILPNPTSALSIIRLPQGSGHEGKVHVFDMQGNLMYEGISRGRECALSVEAWPVGTYQVVWQVGTLMHHGRLVKVN